MKNIVLCADDYGQNPAISQAIINLIEKNRLSATSCMVNSFYWSMQAKWLEPFKNQIDIGLHLNFTHGEPLSKAFTDVYGAKFFSLSSLLFRAYSHVLNKKAIAAEIHAQIDSFAAAMNQLPDFIDGHQHIHQFPVIREILLSIYKDRLQKSYIRCVANKNRGKNLKQWIIQLTGAAQLKKQLIKQNIPHNSSFSGIYDFIEAENYPALFPLFLSQVENKGLIMCHPGLKIPSEADPIHDVRYEEYQYFLSEQFIADCRAQDIGISRLRDG